MLLFLLPARASGARRRALSGPLWAICDFIVG